MAGRWTSFPATPTHLHWTPSHPQAPWLLLPEDDDESDDCLSFAQVITGKYHEISLQEPPFATPWRCRGSSHGWLAILDESPNVVILNPFTGAKLSLPPLSALPPVTRFDASKVGREYDLHPKYLPEDGMTGVSLSTMRDSFIKKIILSDCPSRNPNFTALVIFENSGEGIGNLACCKSGQDRWTLVPGTDADDAVYFEGKVYTVDRGQIYTSDVSCDSPKIEKMEIRGLNEVVGEALYLVSACDELLLVSRDFGDPKDIGEYKTCSFDVFKLSSCESGKKWERVNDLGDRALFLGGHSCSSALKASEIPGCEGNSIYYTEDDILAKNHRRPDKHDMGIYSLKVNRCSRFPYKCNERVSPAYPTWLAPKS